MKKLVSLLVLFLSLLIPKAIFDLPPVVKSNPQIHCPESDGEYCLAVKYVVYMDLGRGMPVVTAEEAQMNIAEANAIWNRCGIAFEIETYMAVDPSEYHFDFNPSTMHDLDQIRMAFEESTNLLVATTGSWEGELHKVNPDKTTVVAWSAFPTGDLHGATLDFPVRNDSQIIAHELGHYLGLPHVENKRNVMNPIVYPMSNRLTKAQCRLAQSTVDKYWEKMTR